MEGEQSVLCSPIQTALATLFNALQRPKWEGNKKMWENIYMIHFAVQPKLTQQFKTTICLVP